MKHLTAAIRKAIVLIALVLIVPALPVSGQPEQPPDSLPENAQRIEVLRAYGGLLSDAVPLPDNALVVAEDDSLLVLRASGRHYEMLQQFPFNYGSITDLQPVGDYITALAENGLFVVRNDALDHVLSFVPGGGEALALHNDVIVIAARAGGVRLLRLDVNGILSTLSSISVAGGALDAAFSTDGQRLYIASGDAGITVLDSSDPAQPDSITTLTQISPAQTIAIVEELLVVGSNDRVLVLDPAGNQLGQYRSLVSGRQMLVQDDYIYVADAVDGLKIYWLAAPDRLLQVYGEVEQPVNAVILNGNIAYLAGEHELRILDIGFPQQPRELGQVSLPGPAFGLELVENRMFVAGGSEGVFIVDASNLSAPRFLKRIPLGDTPGEASAYALTAYQDRLYVAAGEAGVAILNIAQPGAEIAAGGIVLPGAALDIKRRGTALYIAAGTAGLAAVDISRPYQPVLAGTIQPQTGEQSVSLFLSGRRAYVSNGESLTVVDIGRADRMGIVVRLETEALHAGLNGVYLYALGQQHIVAYDARANAEPVYLNTYRAPSQITHITPVQDRVYLTNAGIGPEVVALSLANPAFPYELDNRGSSGSSMRAISGETGIIWLARGYSGLSSYQISEGGALIPLATYPHLTSVQQVSNNADWLFAGGRTGWLARSLATNQTIDAGVETTLLDIAGDAERVALAAGDAGVFLYDIASDSEQTPTLITRRRASGAVQSVTLYADTIAAADSGGLTLFDRQFLQALIHVDTPAPATGIVEHNQQLYLSLFDGSLAIIDPGQLTDTVTTLATFPDSRPYDLVIDPLSSAIYGITDDKIVRFELDMAAGIIERTLQTELLDPAAGLFMRGSMPGVFTPGGAMRVYNPATLKTTNIPLQEISLPAAEPISQILMGGNTVYLAQAAAGLSTFNINQPENRAVLTDEPVNAILRYDDDTLFSVGQTLKAWQIAQPGSNSPIATLPLSAPGQNISTRQADTLLLALENGFSVVRWQDNAFTLIGHLTLPQAVTHVAWSGQYAYLGLAQGGLHLVDLQDAANPQSLFTYSSATGQFVHDILTLPDGSLLVSWDTGIEHISPVMVASLPQLTSVIESGAGQTHNLAVNDSGDSVALAAGEGGVVLVNPANSAFEQIDTPGTAVDVAWLGTTLLVADGHCGLRVFENQQATTYQETGYWTGTYVSSIAVDHSTDNIYVADANQVVTLKYDPALPAVHPPVPQLPEPSDNATNVELNPALRWQAGAAPCMALTYDVYFGLNEDPPFVGQVSGEPVLELGELEPLRTYFWRVEITDRQGDHAIGPLWQFTTGLGDTGDVLPPSPPLLRQQIEDNPLLFVLLVGLLVTALTSTIFWIISRRRSLPENVNSGSLDEQ